MNRWTLPFAAWLTAAAAAQVPAGPAPAAKPAPASTAPTRPAASVHQAWLTEVMDLDSRRAADLYREVARDRGPDNLERWIALARLAELHRLGVTQATTIDPAEVPAPLQKPLGADCAPLDVAALLAKATEDPATLLQGLAKDSAQLPPLRPAVEKAQAWIASQAGTSSRDRIRRGQGFQGDRPRFTDRWNATKVLVFELDGHRAQADEVRSLYFTQWKAPAVSNDSLANLARARKNLDGLLREPGLTGSQADLLTRLRDAIERAAATDPAAAMALLLRLPWYAELLLRDPAQQPR